MKYFKTLILIIFVFVGINATAQRSSSKMSKEDVKKELIEGFAKFVESVRPFYAKGDSFQDFKNKVFFGKKQSSEIMPILPPEGGTMLKKAYDYLSNGYGYSQIIKLGNFETMANAVLFYDKEQKKAGNNKNRNDIEVMLFGGNSTILETNPIYMNRGGCRWWQFSCHLTSIFGDDGGTIILDIIIGLIKDLLS